MRTHKVAEMLSQLARALKGAPDMELEQLLQSVRSPLEGRTSTIAVNISTLAELSRLDKSEWTRFILNYGLPIETRGRDASRDILGKILRYLEDNPEALRRLKHQATAQVKPSPELAKALEWLLRDENK